MRKMIVVTVFVFLLTGTIFFPVSFTGNKEHFSEEKHIGEGKENEERSAYPVRTDKNPMEEGPLGGSWFDDFHNTSGIDTKTDDLMIQAGSLLLKGWELPIWKYRTSIGIVERSGKTLVDYQVPVTLNATNFNYSRALGNGSDIRFLDSNGTDLNYWIENWNAAGESKI